MINIICILSFDAVVALQGHLFKRLWHLWPGPRRVIWQLVDHEIVSLRKIALFHHLMLGWSRLILRQWLHRSAIATISR